MTAPPGNVLSARPGLSRAALAFAPGLLAIQESPPAPLPRAVLRTVIVLTVLLLIWAFYGKLDIIASAEGRLVPQNYIKIVQPAEAGIVKDILVREGQHVKPGEVLLRMDANVADADSTSLRTALSFKSLQLHRIDAELSGTALKWRPEDPPDLFQKVSAQFLDRRQAYRDALATAETAQARAEHDYQSGLETLAKLQQTNPLLKVQAEAYKDLGKDGYVARVSVNDKEREYLENSQDLRAQASNVESLAAALDGSRKQVSQITSKYRSDLQNERVDADSEFKKLEQELVKQSHKVDLLELRAPAAGQVKDLATHTIGTVVSAGTVLLSLVPEHEPLMAEVLIKNEDVGFVHAGQSVQVKLAAYPFQKYGMVQGHILQISPDAAPENDQERTRDIADPTSQSNRSSMREFKALVQLVSQRLGSPTAALDLTAGMEVTAEINEGRRTVLEYLLSPVKKTMQESGRER
jgi:hemolysin D